MPFALVVEVPCWLNSVSFAPFLEATIEAFGTPCTAVYSGTINGPPVAAPPPLGNDSTVTARVTDYNLECTVKTAGTPVKGATVYAFKKEKGSEVFTQLPKTAITNAKGLAKFNIKKFKKGTKVMCSYGSASSKTLNVPKLPKSSK